MTRRLIFWITSAMAVSVGARRRRTREYTPRQYERVVSLRRQHLRYGKMKLLELYRRKHAEDHSISAWKIPHSIRFSGKGYHHSAKASRGKDLEVEHPISCRYMSTFHFYPTLPGVLGSTLIRDKVIQVCEPREKRLLAATWVMKAFHGEQLPLDGIMRLI